MKKKGDPRHKMRVQAVKTLFERNFRPNVKLTKNSLAGQVTQNQKKIDEIISKNAPVWPIDQIASVDLATLRLAIWELLFKKAGEPYRVVIDEAVEIAKEFGSETSGSFINGVLGSIVKAKSITSTKSIKSTTS